jgi:hypothetical protein
MCRNTVHRRYGLAHFSNLWPKLDKDLPGGADWGAGDESDHTAPPTSSAAAQSGTSPAAAGGGKPSSCAHHIFHPQRGLALDHQNSLKKRHATDGMFNSVSFS